MFFTWSVSRHSHSRKISKRIYFSKAVEFIDKATTFIDEINVPEPHNAVVDFIENVMNNHNQKNSEDTPIAIYNCSNVQESLLT